MRRSVRRRATDEVNPVGRFHVGRRGATMAATKIGIAAGSILASWASMKLGGLSDRMGAACHGGDFDCNVDAMSVAAASLTAGGGALWGAYVAGKALVSAPMHAARTVVARSLLKELDAHPARGQAKLEQLLLDNAVGEIVDRVRRANASPAALERAKRLRDCPRSEREDRLRMLLGTEGLSSRGRVFQRELTELWKGAQDSADDVMRYLNAPTRMDRGLAMTRMKGSIRYHFHALYCELLDLDARVRKAEALADAQTARLEDDEFFTGGRE
jgi:hypothetical protein